MRVPALCHTTTDQTIRQFSYKVYQSVYKQCQRSDAPAAKSNGVQLCTTCHMSNGNPPTGAHKKWQDETPHTVLFNSKLPVHHSFHVNILHPASRHLRRVAFQTAQPVSHGSTPIPRSKYKFTIQAENSIKQTLIAAWSKHNQVTELWSDQLHIKHYDFSNYRNAAISRAIWVIKFSWRKITWSG